MTLYVEQLDGSYLLDDDGNKIEYTIDYHSSSEDLTDNTTFLLNDDGHVETDKNIIAKAGTEDNHVVIKKQLDLKLDRSTFIISNSLPGLPVLDKISIALIPALSVITADSNDRVSSWIDPVNNIDFSKSTNSKKPLFLRDSSKKLFFVRFDGSDDYLERNSFDVSEIAGESGNTCTVILVVNTKAITDQSQFQWGRGAVRFGMHIPWGDGTVYIDFGSTSNGRLNIPSLLDLSGNIEVWTIRVNGTNLELFRGVTSISAIKIETISATLKGSAQEIFIGCQVHTDGTAINFCEMDLYAFAVWAKSLSDDELKNMFRFIQNHFDL